MAIGFTSTAILKQPSQTISFDEAVAGGFTIVDVRSPKEFQEGSLPGAVSIPVFNDEERHIIGSIYRYGGQEQAVQEGFSFVGARIDELLESFVSYKDSQVAIICARGGMRSRSIVNLLCLQGYCAWQITGGYKNYRHALLTELKQLAPRLIVLHGHTGTGKTRILYQLSNAIDLEGLAQHQSSLFGGLNRRPRTQKNFDSYVHKTLRGLQEEPFFIEGESRQMGHIFLPSGLVRAMRAGHLVQVTASMETRIGRILEDYPVADDQTVQQVQNILESLRCKLSNTIVDQLCQLLAKGALAELVHILLVEYYDKRYSHSLRKHTYDFQLSSEDLTAAARQLEAFRKSLRA